MRSIRALDYASILDSQKGAEAVYQRKRTHVLVLRCVFDWTSGCSLETRGVRTDAGAGAHWSMSVFSEAGRRRVSSKLTPNDSQAVYARKPFAEILPCNALRASERKGQPNECTGRISEQLEGGAYGLVPGSRPPGGEGISKNCF